MCSARSVPRGGTPGSSRWGPYPLVVDSEVVIEVDNALGLAQETAVRGLGPPVQQVA